MWGQPVSEYLTPAAGAPIPPPHGHYGHYPNVPGAIRPPDFRGPLDPRGLPVHMGPPGPPGAVLVDRGDYGRYPPMHDPVPLERRQIPTRERRSRSPKRRQKSPQRKIKQSDYDNPLQHWTAWRTGVVNHGLTRDLVNNTYREIHIGEDFDKLVKPSRSPNKHGVYHYSSAVDQATQLHKEDFINFGIPRAQVSDAKDPRPHTPSSSESSSDSDEPIYSINKLNDRYKVEGQRNRLHKAYVTRNGYSGEDSDDQRPRVFREHSRSRQHHQRALSPDVQVLQHARYRSYR